MRCIAKFVVVFGLLGLLASGVSAADPTMSLVVVSVNDAPVTPTGSVDAVPGDILEAEFRLRDWSPSGELLRAYQAMLVYDSYFSGTAGDVLPVDFAITTDVNGYCSAGGDQGDPNPTNLEIDADHPLYVFASVFGFALPNSTECDYRVMSTVWDPSTSVPSPQDGTEFYMGMVRLEVSADAAGTFVVDFGPSGSYLRDPIRDPIEPLLFEPLTVNLPGGACNLLGATQACNSVLPRPSGNVLLLEFDCDLTARAVGDIQIHQALPGGAFGADDLAGGFGVAVDPGNSSVLVVAELGDVLDNETWYSFRNAGPWASDFELTYPVVYGDASGDKRTNVSDLNFIWANRGGTADPTDPADIVPNGNVNVSDLNAAWANRGSSLFGEDPPSGHDCPK